VNEDVESELLLESISIRRVIRGDDGAEIVAFEAVDGSGEPMGIDEAMSLLEYSKVRLLAEMIRYEIFGEVEDQNDDEE